MEAKPEVTNLLKNPRGFSSQRNKTTNAKEELRQGKGSEGSSSGEDAHYLNVFMAGTNNKQRTANPRVRFILDGTHLSGVADSGAQINVIPRRLTPESLLKQLKPTRLRIKPYGASSDPTLPLGVRIAHITLGDTTLTTRWYVVNNTPSSPMVPLISCETCVALEILTINLPREPTDITIQTSSTDGFKVGRFQSVFQGIGLLKDYQVDLHLVDKPKPVACAPRYSPFRLEIKVNHEVHQMLLEDIIEHHRRPSPWVGGTLPIQTV